MGARWQSRHDADRAAREQCGKDEMLRAPTIAHALTTRWRVACMEKLGCAVDQESAARPEVYVIIGVEEALCPECARQ